MVESRDKRFEELDALIGKVKRPAKPTRLVRSIYLTTLLDRRDELRERRAREGVTRSYNYLKSISALSEAGRLAIKQLRMDLGMHREDFAKKCGLSKPVIQKAETKGYPLTMRTLLKVAEANNCKLEIKLIPK